MTDEAILAELTAALRAAFELPTLVITRDTAPDEIPGWDSITTVGVAIEIADRFDIPFDSIDLDAITRIGDLIPLIRKFHRPTRPNARPKSLTR